MKIKLYRGRTTGGGGADTTPDAFSFTDLTGQTESTPITSTGVTITGINAATSFSVTGGTIDVNGSGTFVSSGTVNNNDVIRARGTANATYLGTTNVVVTVGGVSDTFTITTRADPSGDFAGAPASVTAPVVGTSLIDVWNLQKTGATGPASITRTWNTTYSEVAAGTGRYPARPNDPYLQGLGYYYNNYGDLWIPSEWIGGPTTVTTANYDFTGAPQIALWGNGYTFVFSHCKGFNYSDPAWGGIVLGADANRGAASSSHTTGLQLTYCELNHAVWALLSSGTTNFESSYCRYKNQEQTLGFGGGNFYTAVAVNINFHHNFVTGGGVVANTGSHVEFWQQIAGSGTGYCYFNNNMVDFTQDGQSNPANTDGWTGMLSEGGSVAIQFRNNIIKGQDIVNFLGGHVSPPSGGMGTVVAYGDSNVTAGFDMTNNAICWNQNFGPSYKHGVGQVLFPTVSNNRYFVDAASAAAGVTGGPADNTVIPGGAYG